jgi:hypothetical protein
MKRDDKAIVTKSWHSDIVPGAVGKIVGKIVRRFRRGYAVEIHGEFRNSAGKESVETCCVFFSSGQLGRMVNPSPRNCNAARESDS